MPSNENFDPVLYFVVVGKDKISSLFWAPSLLKTVIETGEDCLAGFTVLFATISTWPGPTKVTKPFSSTVATETSFDVQVTEPPPIIVAWSWIVSPTIPFLPPVTMIFISSFDVCWPHAVNADNDATPNVRHVDKVKIILPFLFIFYLLISDKRTITPLLKPWFIIIYIIN